MVVVFNVIINNKLRHTFNLCKLNHWKFIMYNSNVVFMIYFLNYCTQKLVKII